MNLQKMISFCAIYECGSISRASEKLFCTQPALSKQISSLEDELGYSLFERSGKKITLNENGKIFYRFAKNVLNDYSLMKRELYIKNSVSNHEVRFGTTNFIGTYILPSILSQFKKEHPEVPVNFTINFLPNIMELIDNDMINFAIIPASDEILSKEEYTCDSFMEDEFVLVTPVNHPLLQQSYISIHDISNYSFLVSQEKSATRQFISKTLKEHNLVLKDVYNLDNINTIKHSIMNGLGISILPYKQVQKDEMFGLLQTRRFDDVTLKRLLYVLYKRKHTFLEEEAIFIKNFIKQ